MGDLLTTWLAGAQLLEIARVVQLAKAELARRGIRLTWSITQGERRKGRDSASLRLKPRKPQDS
jgi:hypothetical protein